MQKASDFCTKEERVSRHTEGMLLLEAALGHDDPVATDLLLYLKLHKQRSINTSMAQRKAC